LHAVVERLQAPGAVAPTSVAAPAAAEPPWSQQLATTLHALVERLQALAPPSPAATHEPPPWSQQLATALQSVVERVQQAPPPAPAAALPQAQEPAWSQALRDALDAMTTRLGAQPMTLVAEPPAVTEPAWAADLRDALARAEARHQDLLARLAEHTAGEMPGLGDQLAGALERGLHDLGAQLAARPAAATLAAPVPMDDSRSALSPVTVVQEEEETRSAMHSTTRTDRVGVDAELVRSLVQREVESHLGRQGTLAVGRRDGTEQIRALVAAELDVRQGGAIERPTRNDVVDLRATMLRLLPDLLGDEAVRHSLFAVLALEAVSKPGALAELTGLRSFLRRELARAAEELAGKLQAV
jgi:hypothetical protein